MTRAELLGQFRIITDDINSADYLWDDMMVYSYLIEAEEEAAFRSNLLEEVGNATYCNVTLASATSTYALPDRVYEVSRCKVSGETTNMDRTDPVQLDIEWSGWEDATGTPSSYFILGNKIRVVPTPTATGTLNMVVSRLPVTPMAIGGPEIPVQYHYKLLDWAVRCAYLKRGLDTYNENKAAEFEGRFIGSFGRRVNANVERKRLKHRPAFVRCSGEWI